MTDDAKSRLARAVADHHQIEGQIGAGNVATVHIAVDSKYHRKVAVKVPLPELPVARGID